MKKFSFFKCHFSLFLFFIFQLLVFSLFVSCENPLFVGVSGLYEIKFSTNGGTSIESYRTDEITEIPQTERTGYSFGGWYTKSDFSGNSVSFPYKLKENATLYARWYQEFLVLFETNGGDKIESYKTGLIKEIPETSRNT